MASKKLQGICIEIDGNTTGLTDALKNVDKEIRSVNGELNAVNKLLKFDPSNTELLAQKQSLLTKAIEDTTNRLNTLKQAKAEADASDDVDKNSKSYRELEREIASTEQNLVRLTNQQDDYSRSTDDATKKTSIFGDVLKANLASEAIKAGVKALASGIKEVASSFVDLGKQAVASFAEYEQLIGGVETLFGESASELENYANQAYKTAGLSANEYMQQATSFSASLLQSLGGDTQKAVKYADQAIQDMADNANKMGTDMSSIQNAYQGFAKQNYTMLDNLKLGYGGTKTEMERLLADAEKFSGQKYDIKNLSDVYEAIHVVQQEMGITGTTAKEASATISGSVNSMKSAWKNLITGIANENSNFGELVDNLMETLIGDGSNGGVINNLIPRIKIAFDGILNVIPTLIEQLLPTVLEMGSNLLTSLITGLTNSLPKLISSITNIVMSITKTIVSMLPQLLDSGIKILLSIIDGISNSLPQLIPTIVDALMLMVNTIIDNLPLIIESGITLIIALITGLMDALPKLLEKIPILIASLVGALTKPDMLAQLITGAIQLIIALATGLIQAIPELIKAVPTVIKELVNNFKETIKNTDWLQLGKNILSGILNGLINFGTVVKDAVKKVGNKITSEIKSFFGIHSPSKLMEKEIGKFIPMGIAEGIEKEIPKTIEDVDNAMSVLNHGIETSVNPTINPTANSNPLIIQIENFNNKREQDIQALAEELEFYRKMSATARGGN